MKTTEILEPAYGYTADDVLELRQGSTARPENIAKLKLNLERAINNEDYKQAKEILENAKQEFGEDSPIYDEMNKFLRINLWVEELE